MLSFLSDIETSIDPRSENIPGNITVSSDFLSLNDLDPTVQGKVKSQASVLRALSPTVDFLYSSRLELPDDPDKIESFLVGYSLGIVPVRQSNPTLAYYGISQNINGVRNFLDHPTPSSLFLGGNGVTLGDSSAYLRMLTEWIAAAIRSDDVVSLLPYKDEIGSRLSKAITRLTGGMSIFAKEDGLNYTIAPSALHSGMNGVKLNGTTKILPISEEMLLYYRWALPVAIVNYVEFLQSIGDKNGAEIWYHKGQRVSEILMAAQSKYDLVLLRISDLLKTTLPDSGKLDTEVGLMKKGSDVLSRVYTDIGDKRGVLRAKYQLQVIQLYSEVVIFSRQVQLHGYEKNQGFLGAFGGFIEQRDSILEFNKAYESEHGESIIDIDDLVKIAHIEILLYAVYVIDRDSGIYDELLEVKELNPDLFKRILNFQRKIAENGLDLDSYIHESNAGVFLTPYIDLFHFRVKNMLSQSGNKRKRISQSVWDEAVDIYRIAVGSRDIKIKRALFRKAPLFQNYIQGVKFLLADLGVATPGSDDEILDLIQKRMFEQEQKSRETSEGVIHAITTDGINFASIVVTNIPRPLDGQITREQLGDQEHNMSVLYSGPKGKNIFEYTFPAISFDKKWYSFTVVTNDSPLTEQQKDFVAQKLGSLVAYYAKSIITSQVTQAANILRHDFYNKVGNLHPLAEMIQAQAQQVLEGIHDIPNVRTLHEAHEMAKGLIPAAESVVRLTKVAVSALADVATFRDRLGHDLKKALGEEDIPQKQYAQSLRELLSSTISGFDFSSNMDIWFASDFEDSGITYIPILFPALLDNILRNTVDYKKETQHKSQVIIASKLSSNGDLLIAITDYGMGMTQKIKDAYLGKGDFPEVRYRHKNSSGLGSQSILGIAKEHGWLVSIESTFGEYTSIQILVPASLLQLK